MVLLKNIISDDLIIFLSESMYHHSVRYGKASASYSLEVLVWAGGLGHFSPQVLGCVVLFVVAFCSEGAAATSTAAAAATATTTPTAAAFAMLF